jgi:hypothetical protein
MDDVLQDLRPAAENCSFFRHTTDKRSLAGAPPIARLRHQLPRQRPFLLSRLNYMTFNIASWIH